MPGTFFHPSRRADENVCRVCGHRAILPARQAVNALLLILIGMLLGYIALDIAHNGRLDGSLYEAIRQTWEEPR